MADKVLRVAVISTGGVGSIALRAINRRAHLDLVGVWVHSPEKTGRDAGEIVGLGPIGVTTTQKSSFVRQKIIAAPAMERRIPRYASHSAESRLPCIRAHIGAAWRVRRLPSGNDRLWPTPSGPAASNALPCITRRSKPAGRSTLHERNARRLFGPSDSPANF